MADTLHIAKSGVIANPYDDQAFHENGGSERTNELVFVGRLIKSKGVWVLLEAIRTLHETKRPVKLVVVGDGPERSAMTSFISRHNLHSAIRLTGPLHAAEIGSILRKSMALVVPSLWQEPFGIVALEAIACGCPVIGSNVGGLPESIGPCGVLFERGDKHALIQCIEKLLASPDLRSSVMKNRSGHLRRHTPVAVANAYMNVIEARHRT